MSNPHDYAIGGVIQKRIAKIAHLEDQVRKHPMTANLDFDGQAYVVMYPEGEEFYYRGIRRACDEGKQSALRDILTRLEQDWKTSINIGGAQ